MCKLQDPQIGITSVFLGLLGLTMVEYGLARKGFGQHLIVKNLLQFSLAIVLYWLTGYAFSVGNTKNGFIGKENFAGFGWLDKTPDDEDYNSEEYDEGDVENGHGYCFTYYALIGIFVIFIVNTALVEKVSYITYVVYPICLMFWIWPVVVAWGWGKGWLMREMNNDLLDYGGSITVFTFAGIFGLVGAILSGKRDGRFENPSNFKIVNVEAYVIGTFLTILGVLGIGYSQQIASGGLALANMLIGGGVTSILSLKLLTYDNNDLTDHYIAIYQGFIGGMVFAANSAANTQPGVLGLHAIINSLFVWFGVKIVKFLRIDDPGNVTGIFLLPGIYGGIMPGFVDDDDGLYFAVNDGRSTLRANTVGTTVIFLWSLFWALIMFGILAASNLLKLEEFSSLEGATITFKGYRKAQNQQVNV